MKAREPLGVEGDWSPRLREVDIIDRASRSWPGVSSGVLRSALESWDIRVNRHDAWYFGDLRRCLRGHNLSAPIVVLNVRGAEVHGKSRSAGIHLGDPGHLDPACKTIAPSGVLRLEGITALSDFGGKTVLALGAGLGSSAMAKAVIRAGATAYIATTGIDSKGHRSWLFFSLHFLYEMGRNGATVKEAWGRARMHDRHTRKFRLYVARARDDRRGSRCTMVAVPRVPARSGDPYLRKSFANRRTDWTPPTREVDVVWTPRAPCTDPTLFRTVLEQWGMKIRLHSCETPEEMGRVLGGHGITAPVVCFLTHGMEDKNGKQGIRIERRLSGVGKDVVMGPDQIARRVRLPGRVVVMEGCSLGDIDTARAFLKGKVRAYLAGAGGSWRVSLDDNASSMFMWHFFYELGVNDATVRQAWDRARITNCETRRHRLYPGGELAGVYPLSRSTVVRAPALLEGFEGDTDNYWERDWNGYRCYRGTSVSPPGGRSGLAFKMNFCFAENPWPELWIGLSWRGHRWVGAKRLSFETYVPHEVQLRTPLKLVFRIVGDRYEYSMPGITLRRGWNKVRLPFASPHWEIRERDKHDWRQEDFALGKVSPVKALWCALEGRGRREEGSVYFDNIRIE